MPPQSNESKSQYQTNEKVLCFHGEFLYEAKIQDLRRTDSKDPKSPFEYKIHYKGWKNTWDDWVSFDRLRKWTDENRELATQLRREHAQAQKPLPKTTSKSRRGQGSEIGSEHPCLPAMSRLPPVQSPFGDPSLVDSVRDLGSLPGSDFVNNSAGQTSNPGSPETPSFSPISSVKSVDLEMDKAEEEAPKAQPMALKKIGQNTTVDLCDFVHQPRRAAVAAASAIHRSHLPSRVESNPAAIKTRKRKGSQDNDTKGRVKRSTSASHARKTSGRLSERSTSQRTLGQARKQPATRKAGRPRADRPSTSKRTSSRGTNRKSYVLSSSEESEDEEVSEPGLADEELEVGGDEILDSVEEPVRKSSATTTVGNLKPRPRLSRKLSESEFEASEEESPAKKRIVRTLPRRSNSQRTTIAERVSSGSRTAKSAAPSLKAVGNRAKVTASIEATAQRPRPARKTQQPTKRPWINKTVEDYTSPSARCLRPQVFPQPRPKSRPHSQAPYYSSSSDTDESQDSDETEDEFQDPDRTEDEESDLFRSRFGGEATLKEEELSAIQHNQAKMSQDLGYEDIVLEEIDGIWRRKRTTPKAHLKLDPPGSGTARDALKWPCHLINKANRKAVAWPRGWDDDAIRSIPDWIFKYIRIELVSVLRYDLLAYRSWSFLRTLPSSSPFWATWNKTEGSRIINDFLARVRAENDRMDAAVSLLQLAGVPPPTTTTGLGRLGSAGNVAGSGTPREVQENLCQLNPGPPSAPLRLFIQDPVPIQPELSSPGYVPREAGYETHFPGFIVVAQTLMPYELHLHLPKTHTYMVLLYTQEDAYYSRPSIRINVPDHLKNLLVDDWEHVTKSQLLVPLPSQAPANYIIDEYFNEERKNRNLESADADVLEEFCAGLKMYFEKAVGKILLYRFERAQLAEVRKLWESSKHKEWDGKGPGDCYGAEHLTRMIVNLPEMIAQTNMDAEAVARLKTELSKFSTWLSRNSTKFFCAKYEKPSAEYHEHAR
ncbi:Esa1p-associated factor [Cladophialophora chaetospira]|uniref:Chromatin modification-related protein EAF3 n=1 Tax=Cladophialophora chaetospira TaxID=386627 RepID=A0AA38X8P6_9EURO|nr:Esa1p-associated factor [Cladophialophora chaetospira]